MKFPEEAHWICPINTGGHWVLVVVLMEDKSILLIDPMRNEALYKTNILKNWRKFPRQAHRDSGQWTGSVLKHQLQIDFYFGMAPPGPFGCCVHRPQMYSCSVSGSGMYAASARR